MPAVTSAYQFVATSGGPVQWLDIKSSDVISTNSTTYQSYPLSIPDTGETLSYEAYYRFRFTGTYTSITGVHVWISAITSAAAGTLYVSGGTTGRSGISKFLAATATPVNTYSKVIAQDANGAKWHWMDSTNFIDLTPLDAVSINGSGARDSSNWLVLQAAVQSNASPGDAFSATYTVEWTES